MRPLLKFKTTTPDMAEATRFYMTAHDFKPQSISVALQNVRWLIATYQLEPDKLTIDTEEHIKVDLKRRQLAPNTIRQRLYAFEYLAAAHGRDVRIAKPPRNKSQIVYLTIGEARRLLDAADTTRDRAILACGLYAGLRPGETCRLLPDDLDQHRRILHVRNTKTSRDRDVPLTREATAILDEWVKCRPSSRTPYLFMTQHDNQLDRTTINRMIARTCRQAGINKKISGHRLRHTAATAMLRLGIPLPEVALHLGDTIETVYTYYLHGDVEELRRRVDEKFRY